MIIKNTASTSSSTSGRNAGFDSSSFTDVFIFLFSVPRSPRPRSFSEFTGRRAVIAGRGPAADAASGRSSPRPAPFREWDAAPAGRALDAGCAHPTGRASWTGRPAGLADAEAPASIDRPCRPPDQMPRGRTVVNAARCWPFIGLSFICQFLALFCMSRSNTSNSGRLEANRVMNP